MAFDDVREPDEYRVLGVRITPMTIPHMHELIDRAIREKRRMVMVSQNLHSVYTIYRDPALRRLQEEADYIRVDGLPVLLFARLLGHDVQRSQRIGWMDWIDPFMTEAATRGWRVFYLGSRPGIADRGAAILRAKYPELQIATHHGYLQTGDERNASLEALLDFDPDIVIVGMGMPRQERWILAHRDSLPPKVFLSSGACMDYVAGELDIPPRWLGQIGLEWLYRLIKEPKRLWFRYLVEPWFALRLFIVDLREKAVRGK